MKTDRARCSGDLFKKIPDDLMQHWLQDVSGIKNKKESAVKSKWIISIACVNKRCNAFFNKNPFDRIKAGALLALRLRHSRNAAAQLQLQYLTSALDFLYLNKEFPEYLFLFKECLSTIKKINGAGILAVTAAKFGLLIPDKSQQKNNFEEAILLFASKLQSSLTSENWRTTSEQAALIVALRLKNFFGKKIDLPNFTKSESTANESKPTA